MDNLAQFLDQQMHNLQRIIKKPSYDELKDKHIKSIRAIDELIEIDDRIARQQQWLRSNLDASPDEKMKVKGRLEEMKELKSELLDKYIELQLP